MQRGCGGLGRRLLRRTTDGGLPLGASRGTRVFTTTPPTDGLTANPNPNLNPTATATAPAEHRAWKTYLSPPSLYHYLLSHSTPPHPALRFIRQETQTLRGAGTEICEDVEGALGLLARLSRAERAVDVGCFTGLSTTALALALPPHGKVVCCATDGDAVEVAKRGWEMANVVSKVELHVGDPLEALNALVAQNAHNTFDFGFIDADKRRYDEYYEACLKLVRPGGVIAIDNTLWHQRVLACWEHTAPTMPPLPKAQLGTTLAIHQFNQKLKRDDRVNVLMLGLGDGLGIVTKK